MRENDSSFIERDKVEEILERNEKIFNIPNSSSDYSGISSQEFRRLYFGPHIESINVITGKNGTGKTTALKAISKSIYVKNIDNTGYTLSMTEDRVNFINNSSNFSEASISDELPSQYTKNLLANILKLFEIESDNLQISEYLNPLILGKKQQQVYDWMKSKRMKNIYSLISYFPYLIEIDEFSRAKRSNKFEDRGSSNFNQYFGVQSGKYKIFDDLWRIIFEQMPMKDTSESIFDNEQYFKVMCLIYEVLDIYREDYYNFFKLHGEKMSNKNDNINKFNDILQKIKKFLRARQYYLNPSYSSKKVNNFDSIMSIDMNFDDRLEFKIYLSEYSFSDYLSKVDTDDVSIRDLLWYDVNQEVSKGSIGEVKAIQFYLRLFSQIHLQRKYNHQLKKVTILIDEPDNNFHPEWSRKFIYSLIYSLNTIGSQLDLMFNVFVTTHSPFIISDLPHAYVFRLGNKKQEENSNEYSFAANIHSLLKSNFYLENTIGYYAEYVIKVYGLVSAVSSFEYSLDNGDKGIAEFMRKIDGDMWESLNVKDSKMYTQNLRNVLFPVIGDEITRLLLNGVSK
ncbi:AAA family ATPase [Erysipelothrix sp. HDW6B]|uniref:AAA family ATPase n=1 Tax=Erysipelothrix sp. HDW6B TaxID=2714929 RepID=UPI00140A8341|nr:AAA family ATPase [Erysipelothrix sp. HDW6B]QIK86612.1 AAA family ATPase [Erysipelothrix sp. HDW6B]